MNKSISFFNNGPDIPIVREYQSSRYPYMVRLSVLTKPPTLGVAEALVKSTVNKELKDRVKPFPKSNIVTVDTFFRVLSPANAPKEEAIKLWSDLSWRCKKICIESCVAAAGFILLILQGLPMTITIVLFVGTVVACCYAGQSLQRLHIAEKELLAWKSPGEDFALRRKATLELPLQKIAEQKSHFHPERPGGTLLGVEIFYLFTKNFEPFAKHLLEKQPATPDEQLQWVVDFFTGNPLRINFFFNNSHLLKEEKWKAVEKFRDEIFKLEDKLNFLREIEKKEMPQDRKAVHQAAAARACRKLNIDIPADERYQQMVLQVLNEEYVAQISELGEKYQLKMSHFCPLFYPQVRKLLEQANQVLLKQQPYALEAIDFHTLDLPLQEYQAILKQYPKNAYENAKYLSADDQYQKFLAEVFPSPAL